MATSNDLTKAGESVGKCVSHSVTKSIAHRDNLVEAASEEGRLEVRWRVLMRREGLEDGAHRRVARLCRPLQRALHWQMRACWAALRPENNMLDRE